MTSMATAVCVAVQQQTTSFMARWLRIIFSLPRRLTSSRLSRPTIGRNKGEKLLIRLRVEGKGRNQFYKYQSNCLDSIYYPAGE